MVLYTYVYIFIKILILAKPVLNEILNLIPQPKTQREWISRGEMKRSLCLKQQTSKPLAD